MMERIRAVPGISVLLSWMTTAVVAWTVMAIAPTPRAQASPRCARPRVLVVLDKSSSMLGGLPEGGSKWSAARAALEELFELLGTRVELGIVGFPMPDACAPGGVALALGVHEPEVMRASLSEAPPARGAYTPLAETLAVVESMPELTDTSRARHVVILTDGWQWCASYRGSMRFALVERVRSLSATGVTVHVVGFGAGVDVLALNRAAMASGAPREGCDAEDEDARSTRLCYQQAHDLSSLRASLLAIAMSLEMERCDGVDNDCDGVVDPGCECVDGAERLCGGGPCGGVARCEAGRWTDCVEPERLSAGTEIERCDGADEDCDTRVDEGASCSAGEECIAGACYAVKAPVVDAARPSDAGAPPPPIAGGCACEAAAGATKVPAWVVVGVWLALLVLAWLRRASSLALARRRARDHSPRPWPPTSAPRKTDPRP